MEYEPPRVIVPIFNRNDYFYETFTYMDIALADARYILKAGDTLSAKINMAKANTISNTLIPPFSMTSNTSGGYVASASSVQFGWEPFNLFSTNLSNFGGAYTSASTYPGAGAYTGAVSTTITTPSSTYLGEWVQLQSPTAFILRRFAIVPRANFSNRAPVDFVVLGSNNGATWTELFRITGNNWSAENYEPRFFNISSPTTAFSHYRLCINRIGSNGTLLNFNGWWLFPSSNENTTYFTSEPLTGFFTLPTNDVVFKRNMAWNTNNISWYSLLVDATNGIGFDSISSDIYIRSSAPATQLELGANSEVVISSTGNTSNVQYQGTTTTGAHMAGSSSSSLGNTVSPNTVFFRGVSANRFQCGDTTNTSLVPLSLNSNDLVNCPEIGNAAGNFEFRMNSTGAGGSFTLTGGTGLLSATAGGNAGQHLALTINGVAYKIALLNP